MAPLCFPPAADDEAFESSDEGDDDGEDEEADDSGDEDGGRAGEPRGRVGEKRSRGPKANQPSRDSEGQDSQGSREEAGGDGKRGRRPRKFPVTPERRLLLDTYYSNHSGYGKPASLIVYELCQQMKMADNTFLW